MKVELLYRTRELLPGDFEVLFVTIEEPGRVPWTPCISLQHGWEEVGYASREGVFIGTDIAVPWFVFASALALVFLVLLLFQRRDRVV